MIDMKLIANSEAATPGQGRAILFVGIDGLMRAKLAGGQVVEVLQGAPGAQGVQGLPGNDGADGSPGANGLNGAQGLLGVQGVPGAQGAQGLPGNDGADGAQGAQGVPGVAGFESVTELATIGQARAGAAALLICSANSAASLLGKMVRVRAMVDTSVNGNVIFSVNAGGIVFAFPALAVTGVRRSYFEATLLIGASVALSSGCSQQAHAALNGTANALFAHAAVSGAVTSGAVSVLLSSAGQSVTTRLAQLEII